MTISKLSIFDRLGMRIGKRRDGNPQGAEPVAGRDLKYEMKDINTPKLKLERLTEDPTPNLEAGKENKA